ncbi:fructose-bisphosphate aldolase class 1 [Marmoricola sp. URHA0025 HA25]
MSRATRAMRDTVDRLLTPGKGMIAPDEHPDRLARALGLDGADPVLRSRHRAMVLEAPHLGRWISAAVIDADGLRFGLPDRGPGDPIIGVRLGTASSLYPYGDVTTAAMKGQEMRAALQGIGDLGVAFLKWRADLDPLTGTAKAYADSDYLAACAAISHAAGLVPVLDIAMPNQRSHSLNVATAVTGNALIDLYRALEERDVDPTAVLVRMNMVRAGVMHPQQTDPGDVGRSTMRVLATCLPPGAPGVLFMSTGMPRDEACADLTAIVTEGFRLGWDRPSTFAFGRALVDRATRAWATEGEHAAHKALAEDCEAVTAALAGPVPAR